MTVPAPPRPGRRAAPRRRVRPSASSVAAVVVLLLAALAVWFAGTRHAAPVAPASAHGQLVDDALTACPQGSGQARILTGSIPVANLGDSGRLAVRPLSGSSRTLPLRRGHLTALPAGGSATALEATGPAAAGQFGLLLDRQASTLAAVPCARPRPTWWFTGAGATLDHTSKLVIANVDPGPAVVDVRVLGEQGAVATVGTRGITVPPRSVRTIALTDIAPQGSNLAIEVHASRGRVAATVADSYASSAGSHAGNEWLPDQQAPSRMVRIAAPPPGAKKVTLLVANPSSLNALVGLRVQGPNGTFTPTEHAQLQIPPDSTRSVDVSQAVGHTGGALVLRSRVPIVAAVRADSGGDSAFAASVRPLEGPAAAAWTADTRARLLLTAGALPARAAVTCYDRTGRQVQSAVLRLSPGSTVSWKPHRGADYVTVSPTEGSVHGAVVLTASGTTEVPLDPVPIRLLRPVVQPGLGPEGQQDGGS